MHARQSAHGMSPHGTVAGRRCRRTALSPDGAVAGRRCRRTALSPDGAVAAPPLPLVPGKTTEGSEESNEE